MAAFPESWNAEIVPGADVPDDGASLFESLHRNSGVLAQAKRRLMPWLGVILLALSGSLFKLLVTTATIDEIPPSSTRMDHGLPASGDVVFL